MGSPSLHAFRSVPAGLIFHRRLLRILRQDRTVEEDLQLCIMPLLT